MDDDPGQDEYVRQVLDAYRNTPGTAGAVRRPDRMTAVRLYQRGVPVTSVENALVLAASRRLFRPPDAAPLATVRSLAYFLPVIEEVLESRTSSDYFLYLRHKLRQAGAIR
jgi:hypothetical protein